MSMRVLAEALRREKITGYRFAYIHNPSTDADEPFWYWPCMFQYWQHPYYILVEPDGEGWYDAIEMTPHLWMANAVYSFITSAKDSVER